MGLIKNLALGGASTRRLIPRAEAFFQDRLKMSFMSDAECNRYLLSNLKKNYESCDGCSLSAERTNVVFGSGYCGAELLVVGEAPGEQEDLEGKPFVGPSGFILRKLAKRVGIEFEKVAFITNTVMCRPPKNRKPERDERQACLSRLQQTADILRPSVILLVGATAGHWAGFRELGVNRGLVPREKWTQLGLKDGAVRLRAVVLTYHPAWVMRQGTKEAKQLALSKIADDLRIVKKVLDNTKSTKRKAKT